jgi:hypothetical protein
MLAFTVFAEFIGGWAEGECSTQQGKAHGESRNAFNHKFLPYDLKDLEARPGRKTQRAVLQDGEREVSFV